MNINNTIKINFDTAMFLLFVLEYNTMMAVLGGMKWHEITGLVVGGMFILHMIIDWQWIKTVTVTIFQKKVPGKTRLAYINDWLMFLEIIYVFVSGVACSSYLFPSLNFGPIVFMKNSHKIVSFFLIISLGVHIGLNWKWAVFTTKKIFKIASTGSAVKALSQVMAVALLIFGVYVGIRDGFYLRCAGQFYDHSIEPRMLGKTHEDLAAGINPLSVIVTWTAITAVFAIFTYYVEKSGLESKKLKIDD